MTLPASLFLAWALSGEGLFALRELPAGFELRVPAWALRVLSESNNLILGAGRRILVQTLVG